MGRIHSSSTSLAAAQVALQGSTTAFVRVAGRSISPKSSKAGPQIWRWAGKSFLRKAYIENTKTKGAPLHVGAAERQELLRGMCLEQSVSLNQ